MASLAHSLRSFNEGSISHEELLAEVDRILAEGRGNVAWLLDTLKREHSKTPLPEEVHEDVKRRIELAIQGKLDQADAREQPVDAETGTSVQSGAGNQGAAETGEFDEEDLSQTRLATRFVGSGSASTNGHGEAVQPVTPDPVTPASQSSVAEPVKGVGDVLNDRFVLEARVGAGGMSTVYKALDRRKQEAHDRNPYVAVKILNVEFRAHPQSLIALQREAKKSQSLAHPNIVRVYDFDRDGPTVYMTMEYLSGQSLSQTLRAPDFKGMDQSRALHIIQGMADALRFAHENGIVHADFKPANVILTDTGEVKVIDFGIARAFQRPDQADMEQTRFDPGSLGALTPTYASPEMLEYNEVDPRDDIYALACIAYEMLTGRHPFGRMQATEARDGGLQPERRHGLSHRQWRAMKSALEFDREKRTPTVAQFCQDMNPTRGSMPVSAALGIVVVASAVVAAGVIGYFSTRMPVTEPPVVAVPETPAPATSVGKPVVVPEARPVPGRYVAGETFRDCPSCPQLVVVPAGSYMQGSPATDEERFANEGPQHKVEIAYPLAVGTHEVTVAEYEQFVAETGHRVAGCRVYDGDWKQVEGRNWSAPGFDQGKMHPASCISWNDARDYVAWLSESTDQEYRLLSAAEWEYVARANDKVDRAWGDDLSVACKAANVADQSAEHEYPGWQVHECNDSYVHTAPVGSFESNQFGVYDILGNVFEWVEDCWHDSYRDAPADGAARLSGDCSHRELRGGSWYSMPRYVRSAFRNRFDRDYRSSTFGLRVARVIDDDKN